MIRDALAVRMFVKRGIPVLLAQSFAKNMGLYGERAGCLHLVCNSKDQKVILGSQMKRVIRYHYSSPPAYGARIVLKVLSSPKLKEQWKEECAAMSVRIRKMRHALVERLAACGSTRDWSHVTRQIGMFSYTGLTPAQCERMIKEFHVYLTANGRISLAGLNDNNIAYVAECMHKVTSN